MRRLRDAVTPDFRVALLAGVIAVAGLIVDATWGGGLHDTTLHVRLFTIGGAAGFLIFSVIAIRSVASEVHRVVAPRTGPSHAGVLRWVVTLAGYAVVLITTLGVLRVPIGHLLLGGALTGVILGIAAQQALGNIFAGVVLLLARPFNVGDPIRIRSGAFGGELTGVVVGMGMTYVTLLTTDGPLSLPNSGVLAAVIGPQPPVAAE
jgi:small-conductance mechanosensitive channel